MAKHSCKCFMLHLDKEFRILPNIKGSQGPYFIRKLSPLLIKPDVVVDVLKKKKKARAETCASGWCSIRQESGCEHCLRRTSHLQSNHYQHSGPGIWKKQDYKLDPTPKPRYVFLQVIALLLLREGSC